MSARHLYISVPGVAAPQGSKRALGPGRMIESSQRVRPWRSHVTACAIDAATKHGWELTEKAVHVQVVVRLPRPKSHYGTGRNANRLKDSAPRWPTGRGSGDADKLARALLDALTDAGIWRDDAQVVVLDVEKIWTEGAPYTTVEVQVLEGQP